jgi:hypothetical protein
MFVTAVSNYLSHRELLRAEIHFWAVRISFGQREFRKCREEFFMAERSSLGSEISFRAEGSSLGQ